MGMWFCVIHPMATTAMPSKTTHFLASKTSPVTFFRATDEERQKKGCIGKNFVYNNNEISSQYFWSPTRNEVCGSACFSIRCEGPPRHVHGGAIAAALDDAMSQVANKYLSSSPDIPQDEFENFSYERVAYETSIPKLPAIIEKIENAGDQNLKEKGGEVGTSPSNSTPATTNKKKKSSVTGILSIHYRKAIPLNSCQIICARVYRREGRKVYVVAEVSDGSGTTFVEATGIWVIPRKHLR